MKQPGLWLHQLTGNRRGVRSIRVSGNWQITFRFEDGEAVDVGLEDYHQRDDSMSERIRTHPGANLKDCLEAEGWSVNEFADRLEISRATASRLLNGRQGISPEVALALERIGWSNAEFWMRRQASYDLSVARNRAEGGARDYDDV